MEQLSDNSHFKFPAKEAKVIADQINSELITANYLSALKKIQKAAGNGDYETVFGLHLSLATKVSAIVELLAKDGYVVEIDKTNSQINLKISF